MSSGHVEASRNATRSGSAPLPRACQRSKSGCWRSTAVTADFVRSSSLSQATSAMIRWPAAFQAIAGGEATSSSISQNSGHRVLWLAVGLAVKADVFVGGWVVQRFEMGKHGCVRQMERNFALELFDRLLPARHRPTLPAPAHAGK